MHLILAHGDLFDGLRDITGPAHKRLEADLQLLAEPLSQSRFTHVLERFYGFHHTWEPAVTGCGDLSALLEGRSRLAALEADLQALGRSAQAIRRLPTCRDAEALAQTPAAALGSLYVLEGSTLGGKVIARTLSRAAWLPPGGLSYFDPYGERTGAMWRGFKQQSRELAPRETWPEIADGAQATFEMLRTWLAAAPEEHPALTRASASPP